MKDATMLEVWKRRFLTAPPRRSRRSSIDATPSLSAVDVPAKRLEEILGSGTLDIRYRKHRDRFGRLLALLKVNSQNVGRVLITESLAVRYKGSGPKMDWCPRYRR
jgi:hypothetical protein